ncbi:putative Ig domain-containing protein [Dyadobacter sp. CY312]|uniref:putative Ig domain-containing protein n=1 Tax=Dyadobacter sp. CY312 TaxID=2907303 RepID=UPI001F242315|nr:putative Ig domain-containing protein [Dyadobacter sp. CY312]MCE7042986.1 putative Ig domain-containing protein [Dyadobacter sp. CY312]
MFLLIKDTFQYQKIILALFFVLKSLASYSQNTPSANEVDPQRYLAVLCMNLTVEKGPELDIIRQAKQNGLNAVYLTLPWDKIYLNSPTETPSWARFDEQINLATSLGMKVALRVHLARHTTRIKNFWEISDSQISNFDLPLSGGYRDTFFGFDNQPITNKAIAFVKEAATRYKHLQTEKKLLFVTVTNTPTQEGEYPGGIIINDKEEITVYDYSSSMRKGFKEWLKPNYKKIERLNFLWGTHYKSFDEVPLPGNRWEPFQSFRQRAGKDMYIYRHNVMKQFVNQMIGTIKSVDPGIKFVADYGSVFDGMSAIRGTLGYKSLSEKADGIKVNDDLLTHDHRWSVDILKSDAPAHFITANELFVNASVDNATHLKQLNENFAHGANMVAVVISTVASMQKAAPFLQQASATWLNQPITPIVYKDEVSYKLSAAVEKSGAGNVIYSDWAKKAYADPSNPKPVRIRVDEDLFSPKYWDDASNYAPYVFRPIPMQIIAVNRDFTYRLPTDTFSDVDGTIVRMDVSLLPSWLRYEGGQLKGRPTVLGDHRILVKGFDDEGASSEAYFTIRVDTRENANKPPVVNTNFSNQTIAIDKAFSLTIPKDAFIDTDGEVTKVEVIEMPSWLKFANGAFTGTPTVLGEYRISLKAYDDLNAFVETYFTLKVVEPQFLNNPPYAIGSFPIKYASVNTPFTYAIPNDIFTDSDGYISSITIQNRPSWLDVALNVISGTPPEEGEHRLIVRAYDNFGAYAEVPFIIRVEIPRLRFELVKGGSAVNQQIIRPLQHDDVLDLKDMPPLLNIFAYGNFDYDQVVFSLKGPVNISSKTMRFPYALFESEGGFTPFVGRYTLTVTATNKDASIISNTMQFGISYGDSLNITRGIEAWNFYPNPVESVINIKLPDELPEADIRYYVINSLGKKSEIPLGYTNIDDHLVNIDLRSMQLASGIYFIHLESNGQLLKQFKIFKK